MQNNEPGLFDFEEADEPKHEEPLATEEHVASIRRAFETAGITSMDERRQLIESCTVRPITNIRQLRARDVRPILRRIYDRQNAQQPASGSSWDNREGDTWIDKL